MTSGAPGSSWELAGKTDVSIELVFLKLNEGVLTAGAYRDHITSLSTLLSIYVGKV